MEVSLSSNINLILWCDYTKLAWLPSEDDLSSHGSKIEPSGFQHGSFHNRRPCIGQERGPFDVSKFVWVDLLKQTEYAPTYKKKERIASLLALQNSVEWCVNNPQWTRINEIERSNNQSPSKACRKLLKAHPNATLVTEYWQCTTLTLAVCMLHFFSWHMASKDRTPQLQLLEHWWWGFSSRRSHVFDGFFCRRKQAETKLQPDSFP